MLDENEDNASACNGDKCNDSCKEAQENIEYQKADKSKEEGTGGIVDKFASYSHKLQWLLQTFEYWIADYITHLSK